MKKKEVAEGKMNKKIVLSIFVIGIIVAAVLTVILTITKPEVEKKAPPKEAEDAALETLENELGNLPELNTTELENLLITTR